MASSKKAATRERVLNACWQLLREGAPTRLQDVAEAAGVTRQTVYLHFGSRGALLLALVAHIDRILGLSARLAEVSRLEAPEARLEALLALVATYEVEIHEVAMAMVLQARDDADLRRALEDRMDARRRQLRDALEPLAEAGRLDPDWSLDEVVDVLWEAGSPTSFHHLVVERGWPPERFAAWLVRLGRTFVT